MLKKSYLSLFTSFLILASCGEHQFKRNNSDSFQQFQTLKQRNLSQQEYGYAHHICQSLPLTQEMISSIYADQIFKADYSYKSCQGTVTHKKLSLSVQLDQNDHSHLINLNPTDTILSIKGDHQGDLKLFCQHLKKTGNRYSTKNAFFHNNLIYQYDFSETFRGHYQIRIVKSFPNQPGAEDLNNTDSLRFQNFQIITMDFLKKSSQHFPIGMIIDHHERTLCPDSSDSSSSTGLPLKIKELKISFIEPDNNI